MLRNPPWTRDELIVTLHFYLTHAPYIPIKNSEDVFELSDFLNRLQPKLGGDRPDKFRNRNAVYMKLMNFRRFDPEYEGTGLQRGNKDEREVWNLYSSRREELRRVSDAIRAFVSSDEIIPSIRDTSNDEYEGEEGQVLTRVHRYRERDNKLVKRKKEMTLKEHQALVCDVCGFNFESFYGDRGRGYIECHHTKPLSELSPQGERTQVSDLSLVCSNCHRIIHRGKPWLLIDELRGLAKRWE